MGKDGGGSRAAVVFLLFSFISMHNTAVTARGFRVYRMCS